MDSTSTSHNSSAWSLPDTSRHRVKCTLFETYEKKYDKHIASSTVYSTSSPECYNISDMSTVKGASTISKMHSFIIACYIQKLAPARKNKCWPVGVFLQLCSHCRWKPSLAGMEQKCSSGSRRRQSRCCCPYSHYCKVDAAPPRRW